VLVGEEIEVRANLIVELRVEPPCGEQGSHARKQCPDALHDPSSSSRLTSDVIRAHCLLSAARCFSPARVIS
jgi:hypothetical protein